MIKDYNPVTEVVGPLMAVEGVEGAEYDELVEIELQSGEKRCGRVVETDHDVAMVQTLEGTKGINLQETTVRLLGRPLEFGVSEDMIGRIFDGLGRPIDNGPKIIPEDKVNINGSSISPISRDYPSEFIETGVPIIDGLNTLVREQKLPTPSGSGFPHNKLAVQIARQAKVLGKDDKFAVVFAAMGITFEEAQYFVGGFNKTRAIDRIISSMNLADGPAIERLSTPKVALTCAKFLAFEKGMHVLVIMTDMTDYAEALREVSAARKEVPGRRGYPGYLYTDPATLYEGAGKIAGREGFITQIPILIVPEDDITHPIPDSTGYITEGQITLSRELYKKSYEPPINAIPSLLRLKDRGTGKGKIRGDHADTMNQTYAGYASGLDTKRLSAIPGESALSDADKAFAKFAERLEREYVDQGYYTDRSIEETLNIGWDLLKEIPRTELKRIKDELIDKYLGNGEGADE